MREPELDALEQTTSLKPSIRRNIAQHGLRHDVVEIEGSQGSEDECFGEGQLRREERVGLGRVCHEVTLFLLSQ